MADMKMINGELVQDVARPFNEEDIRNFCEYCSNWLEEQVVYVIGTETISGEEHRRRSNELYHKYLTADTREDIDYYGEEHLRYIHTSPTYAHNPKECELFLSLILEIEERYYMCMDSEGKINERFQNAINNWALDLGLRRKVEGKNGETTYKGFRVKKGTKMSRVVWKIAKMCGITAHTNIVKRRFIADNGKIWGTRTKDIGWNMHFAYFADAVNPKTIKRKEE